MDSNDKQDIINFESTTDVGSVSYTKDYGVFSKPEYADFKNSLERPILVSVSKWSVGASIDQYVNIAGLWANNPAIASKLLGWTRMRADFKVRVQVSASPFHYSELMLRAHPLVNVDDSFNSFFGSYGPPSHIAGVYLSPTMHVSNASMRPGITLYVGEDTNAEFTWPFTYPHPFIDLYNKLDAVNQIDSYFGIELLSAQPLRVVSDTGPEVTVSIWVTATNIELSGPSYPIDLQSGVVEIIEEPTIPFKYTVKLQSSYMDAAASVTETVAEAVGCKTAVSKYVVAARKIGRALQSIGLCVQSPDTSTASVVSSNPLCGLSSVHKETTAARSSLVSKGVGSEYNPNASYYDNLDIESLCNREMFLTSVNWSSAVSAGEAIWTAGVTPFLCNTKAKTAFSGSPAINVQYSPMGYIARMFKYWRGDIKFRLRVVSSSMHRGKLRLVYNPHIANVDVATAGITEGFAVSKIIDLAEGKEMEFIVPFDAATAFLNTMFEHSRFETGHGTSLTATRTMNGSVTLYVMNELTSPNVLGDASISVYISGHNMHFMQPVTPAVATDSKNSTSFSSMSVFNSAVDFLDVQSGAIALEQSSNNVAILPTVLGGEDVRSLKDMIQRSTYIMTLGHQIKVPPNNTTTQWLVKREVLLPTVPRSIGVSNDGGMRLGLAVKRSDGVATVMSVTPHCNPLAYLAHMFLGWKGGIRWTYSAPDFRTTTSGGQNIRMLVRPVDDVPLSIEDFEFTPLNLSSYATQDSSWLTSGAMNDALAVHSLKGYSFIKDGSNSVCEYVHHDYSPLLFNPTRLFNDYKGCGLPTQVHVPTAVTAIDPDITSDNLVVLETMITGASITAGNGIIIPPVEIFSGASDDFTFFHFMTIPVLQFGYNTFIYDNALDTAV